MQPQLPRRAINALLYGRYGSVGGKTMSKRARHLTRIAAAYTHDELLAEHGVGATVAAEIQIWLEAQGLGLRRGDLKESCRSQREPHLLASTAD